MLHFSRKRDAEPREGHKIFVSFDKKTYQLVIILPLALFTKTAKKFKAQRSKGHVVTAFFVFLLFFFKV